MHGRSLFSRCPAHGSAGNCSNCVREKTKTDTYNEAVKKFIVSALEKALDDTDRTGTIIGNAKENFYQVSCLNQI